MSSRLKSNNILLIVISLIVCCTFVQALNELEVEHLQPPHFETHEINDQKNQATNQNDQLNVNLVNSKSESSTNNDERTSLTDLQSSSVVSTSSSSSSSGNLPAADQLNPRFELPPAQFSNSRQSNALQQPPNALEAALSGYGQVRKSPQFQSDSSSYSSNTNANNVANYQRQPQQMISVLSGGASLHQSVSWNPPNPPQFNSNAYSASSSSSSNNPFNNFNSAVSSQSGNNNEFVPSSPPKVHETNDYTSHDVHVNSRPHSIPVEATRELNRELSRDSSVTISSGAPLQNSRQFESQPVVNAPVEKPVVESSQPANGKQKPAHTVVKGDGKKDDVVIYYYYYYDDDKNKTTTGSSTASPSLDVIPSLDQYDNVPVKKVAPVVESIIPSTQSPKPLNVQPIVPVQHQSNNAALNKPTEFKIDGNTFKFDTTGFTPITSTPSTVAYQNNNLFRGQDRGVHVHPNPLYGNGDNLHASNNLHHNVHPDDDLHTQTERNSLRSVYTSPAITTTTQSSIDYQSNSIRSTNSYLPINVINNVYRYQNGFSGIGPELDPARQYAQIENYGLNLQKGSQKFLPKLPSPAFVDVISNNNQNSQPVISESLNNQNDYLNNGNSVENHNNRTFSSEDDRFRARNYESTSILNNNNNNQEDNRPDNEFINEPIAVHVHNHHLEGSSRVQQPSSTLNPRGREQTTIRSTIATVATVEQFEPTQPSSTTFESTRDFDTTITRNYDHSTTLRVNSQVNNQAPSNSNNALVTIDVSSPTTSTTTTTTTTTTTQAPATSTKPVAESIDERKPNFGGRRRFGGNSVAPAVRSSSQSSSNSVSSNVPANTRGSNTNSNSNLSSSRSRSRLTPSSTTTTARPRVRSTTSASASVSSGPAVTRASLPPRRGFFSSRNRNNLNEEPNKPKEESNSVSVTTVSSNTVAGSSTTTAASRKFGSNATNNRSRGFAPSRSRDSSSVSSTTQAPISRFTSSSTSAPSSVNSSPNSSSNSINAARLNSLRGRPSFSRSRQPAVTRGVSSRGQPATIPSSNKKDEPSNVAVTATSDKPEDKKTETSSVTATSDKPEDKKSETSSSDNSSSIVTESTTQQSTTVNSRSRNNPLFRSRPRSNLFGNRG